MSIVNINIKNCNCSGGSSSGTGESTGNDVFDGEPAVSVDTPPKGYSQSAVNDRACKTAIWIYEWVHSWLSLMQSQSWIATQFVAIIAISTVGKFIIRPLAALIGSLIGAVIGLFATPGPTPDDLVIASISGVIAAAMVENAAEYGANKLTQGMVDAAVVPFEDNRDGFICQIARGGNPNAAASNLTAWMADKFPDPIQWIIFNLTQVFLNLAYFSADWWPGFEDEIAGITETCCGGLIDGEPITPGSAKACTGANFVLDNLVGALTAADSYVQNYSRNTYNSLNSTETIILNNVQTGYSVPENVKTKAWSWQLCQAELARYMHGKLTGDSWLTPGQGVTTWELGRLGADLQVNTPLCELRDAETAQAAYTLLAGQIDTWLTGNVTDQDLAGHIRLFCQGLIHPDGAFIGVLFAESADLAGFAGSSDCSECVGDGTIFDFENGTLHGFAIYEIVGGTVSLTNDGSGMLFLVQAGNGTSGLDARTTQGTFEISDGDIFHFTGRMSGGSANFYFGPFVEGVVYPIMQTTAVFELQEFSADYSAYAGQSVTGWWLYCADAQTGTREVKIDRVWKTNGI